MRLKQHSRFGFIALHTKRISRTPSAKKTLHAVAAMALSLVTFQSALANVNLATAPVFLKESVDPNLMFIYDDSASMSREYMPDSIANDLSFFLYFRTRVWYYSSQVNKVYYDPDIIYRAPFKPDGTGRRDANDFENAWFDGYTENGNANLNESYPTARVNWNNSAFYYDFDSTVNGCDANPKNDNCYSIVFLTNESDEQKQNFANWYAYYRTRAFASRAGISEAFFDLPQSIRLGYGALGSDDQDIDGEDMDTIISGVRPYTSARRTEFLTWLQGKETNLGFTPLRTSLEDAGEYYSRTDNQGPWGGTPGTNDTTPQIECRPSYTILMTDGVYNGGSPSVGNADKTAAPAIRDPARPWSITLTR